MINRIFMLALPLTALVALSACDTMGMGTMGNGATNTASDTMDNMESSVATEAVDEAG